MKFSIKYLSYFLILFGLETLIALYVHDSFIRPFLGDVFVVVLLYFFVRIFISTQKNSILVGIFLFACSIEVLQYINIVKVLGLEQNRLATIVIGTTFDWMDILAYFIGCLGIFFFTRFYKK
ncbi:MAG: DUF2809 domain-containing protein [Flavobacteriales bacterium]